MTAMTRTAIPVQDEWTAIYTASGTVTINLQNIGNHAVRVRVDQSAAVSDDPDSVGYSILLPGEYRQYALISGDDVIARPDGRIAGIIAEWL